MSPTGLLVLDKPSGMTSHDVVARVRRILGTRKVGHAGTLDPMATGILVIGVGAATRLLGHLALSDKDYSATARLGVRTVSDDAEGDVLTRATARQVADVSDDAVLAAAAALRGDIDQRPSAVSAIKVDGRRAHERVRSGEQVVLAARRVHVARLDVTDLRRSDDHLDIDLEVTCSTGTYVRALARDIGDEVGIGGHLTRLRRTRVGPFGSGSTLEELADRGSTALLPLGEAARQCFPVWTLDPQQADAASVGRRIPWGGPGTGAEPVAMVDSEGRLIALAVDEAGTARYLAVLA